MARSHHQVADFNTIEDLIEHAERELGATHVTVELVRGTGRAGPGTRIYFPRSGQYPYEEARVWRESRYWHTEGPGARTGIRQLPENAMTIERYLTRGGRRRQAAEGRSDPLKQAKDAGEQYARDQIEGDHFQQWVRDQIYEASRMDPSQVLPLETKDDAKVIAENMLQHLGWDAKRELAWFEIIKMIGTPDGDVESDTLDAFYEGFDEALHDPKVVDWLADEILHIHEQVTGRTGEARRSGEVLLVFSNAKRALQAADAWEAGEDAEDPEGKRTRPKHTSSERFVDVDKKGVIRQSSGGQGNAIVVGGDIPWLINTLKKARFRFKMFKAGDFEPGTMLRPGAVDLSKGHRTAEGAEEAKRKRHPEAPPKRFKSPGGRTFTLGSMEADPPRFEGDPFWQEMWPILYKGKPAGKLFHSATYRAPLEWNATIRELYWKYAKDAPSGIGFDVAAFATPKEALEAWGRSADQILDWSEDKPVDTPYGRRKRSTPRRTMPRRRSRKKR